MSLVFTQLSGRKLQVFVKLYIFLRVLRGMEVGRRRLKKCAPILNTVSNLYRNTSFLRMCCASRVTRYRLSLPRTVPLSVLTARRWIRHSAPVRDLARTRGSGGGAIVTDAARGNSCNETNTTGLD